jgi:RNA polymerase sigma factor (sigma-70 family)
MSWRPGALLRHLCQLSAGHGAEDFSDRELVARYAAGHDQAAFETLMRRHGPLVWRVCLHMTRHEQTAEDAFQATFLVLARRAGAIRNRESLASWLHAVAYRVALQARAEAPEASGSGYGVERMAAVDPLAEATQREQLEILHQELSRLAEKYRAPLLLCYLEGRTQEEAARQLAWSPRTLRRRLGQARGLLQARLERRGLGLAAVLGGASLAPPAQSAAVPAGLVLVTLHAAQAFATRSAAVATVSTKAAALAQAVLRATAISPWKPVLVLAVVCIALAGTGVLAYRARAWLGSGAAPGGDPVTAEAARLPQAGPKEENRLDAFGDPLPEGAQARLGTTRFCVGEVVYAFAFAPDGRTLAAAGDGCIWLWDPATGKALRRLEVPGGGYVYALAFAPGGEALAVGGQDAMIRLWDRSAAASQRAFGGHGKRVSGLIFSPDGRTLASVGADGTLRLWRVATGEECCRILVPGSEGDYGLARPIAFFPDNRTVATQDQRYQVRLWDVTTGKELPGLDWLPRELPAVAVAPDGTVLAGAAKHQATVRLWRVASGQELPALHHRGCVSALAFSADSTTLASGSVDGTIRLWRIATGTEVGQAHTGERLTRGLAFSPDGRLLASGSEARLRLWATATGAELHPSEGHRGGVTAVAFLPDRRLLSAGALGTAILWDAGTGRLLASQRRAEPVREPTTALSPDGRMMAAGDVGGVIRVSDPVTGQEISRWPGHKKVVYSLAFAPDGQTLASGGQDETLALWEPVTGREVGRFAEGHGAIVSAAFSPDGRLVAWGDANGTVGLREATTGKVVHRLAVGSGWGWGLAFSPDGKTLASATTGPLAAQRRGTLALWEVATGRARWQTPSPEGGVYCLRFAPDGRTLASGGGDHRVHRWDLATGLELAPLAGHLGQVLSLAYSPEGMRLASGSMDSTALIWKQTAPAPLPTLYKAALTPAELEALWTDLAADDAERAYRAIWAMAAAAGPAVPFLEKRLALAAPMTAPEPEKAKATSDTATASPPPERLRALRAVEVLERAGTPQAYQLLQVLANRTEVGQMTEDARAALARLERLRSTAP